MPDRLTRLLCRLLGHVGPPLPWGGWLRRCRRCGLFYPVREGRP